MSDWKIQLKNSVRTLRELSGKLGVRVTDGMLEAEKEYPILVSEYYLSLINEQNYHDDPVWKQCVPSREEAADQSSDPDPMSEEKQMPVKRLIHRYPDRAVLLTTNMCPVLCRFCFRKRYWKTDEKPSVISDGELKDVYAYLIDNPGVREILVSGGDPLMLGNRAIKKILDCLFSVTSIQTVRIGSRMPVTLPDRIDSGLVKVLKSYEGLWFVTHFNHPIEITDKSMAACRRLLDNGIPVLNQTVLLKGINDDAVVLEELFTSLVRHRIKPLYLFHVDPVRGARHFETGIEQGLEILKYFRRNVSSLATPLFAIDLPEGGGKVHLQSDYRRDGKYMSIDDGKLIGYPADI